VRDNLHCVANLKSPISNKTQILPDLETMNTAQPEPKIRLPKPLIEKLSKDEFCVLAYYQTNQPKTLRDLQRNLGIGSDRIIRTLSSLKEKQYVRGWSTRPESIELMPTTLPSSGDVICYLPTWVLLNIKGRAADKQLLCYYFREEKPFIGSVDDLADGLGMKHRNANYCLSFMSRKKIISRVNTGHKITLTLLERPKRFFGLFG
jgi:hypothetical protein